VPQEVVLKLHKEVTAILNTTEITERVLKDGATVATNSPFEFAAFMRAESARWGKVARFAGI